MIPTKKPDHTATQVPLRNPSAIVLVDDEQDAPFFFSRLLRRAGAANRLIPFVSGNEAIAYFARALVATGGVDLPLVVFLNIQMPETGGFEVLRWIRTHDPLGRMPVVMCSDSADPEYVAQAAVLGANCYILKFPPVDDIRRIMEDAGRQWVMGPAARGLFRLQANLMINPFPMHTVLC